MNKRIDKPGIYELSEAEYHADPVVVPSLSRSIALVLCEDSPAHAEAKHPRLGGIAADNADDTEGEVATDAKEDRDAGKAAHSIFLRGENIVELMPFDNYRTKAAKEARDAALAAGRIPLKQKKYDDIMRLVEALENLRAKTGLFTRGKPEQTLVWQVGPIWCRCMVDWLPDDPAEPLLDLKTTAGRAKPATWGRQAFDKGYDLQAVFYPEGAAELRDGVVASMAFIVAETQAPYGIRRFELTPDALEIGAQRMGYARGLWERCVQDKAWPNYALDPEWIEAPIYVQREWDWKMRQRTPTWAERNATREAATQRIVDAEQFGG